MAYAIKPTCWNRSLKGHKPPALTAILRALSALPMPGHFRTGLHSGENHSNKTTSINQVIRRNDEAGEEKSFLEVIGDRECDRAFFVEWGEVR
jgi:hypothetical protein